MDAAPLKTDSSRFCPVEETLKVFSMGPEVHMENADLQRPVVVCCKYRLLDGVHAADGRAVAPVNFIVIPAADALEESHFHHRLTI